MSIKSVAIAFFSLFIIILSTAGCKKKCGVCDFGTTCKNGYCFCLNGKEGDSCNTYSATKYIHNYYASDACSGSGTYSTWITWDDPNNPSRISINGLFNLGYPVAADIYSDASKQGVTLGIPDQNLGAVQVSGNGTYQMVNGGASITLNLDYVSGGIDHQCTVILWQQ